MSRSGIISKFKSFFKPARSDPSQSALKTEVKTEPIISEMRPPSANVVFAAAKTITIKPHVPMIKFRKSAGLASGHDSTSRSTSGQSSAPSTSTSTRQPNVLLEDWQLPPRYRRRPLDEKEIEYINRGGPE